MKIGQSIDPIPAVAQTGQVATPKTAQGNAPAAGKSERNSPGVGVTVSESARTLEQTRASDASEVDLEKVKSVRAAIAQKTFQVNPEAIADKLLANAREMLQRAES